MTIYKPNMALISKLSSSFATMEYFGEYKAVKKARAVNEHLAKYLKDNGVNAVEVGTPCPYGKIMKSSKYTISLGAKLNYKRKVEANAKRNGVECDYHKSPRDLGMFPIVSEMLWCKNDLSELYVRCYQVSKPKPTFFVGDTEVKKAMFAQWATNDDYKSLSGEQKNESVLADEDDCIIFAQDEDGKIILGDDGEPQTISLPPLRAVKISNCRIWRKGEDLTKTLFTSEEWDLNELAQIRDAYFAKFNG